MTSAVVSLCDIRNRNSDWSNQELAEFHRVAGILRRSGLDVEIDRGLTDEGDAWLVYCHAETGDVIAHFARIDGQYVVAAPTLDRSLQGLRFNDLVDSFLDRCPIMPAPGRARPEQRRVFVHPLAALTALIATLFMLSDLSKAQAAEASTAHDGDTPATKALPPKAVDVVRDVFYTREGEEHSADRRDELRAGGSDGHRAEMVLAAIAIAVAIAADDAHSSGNGTTAASRMTIAEITAEATATHDANGLPQDDWLDRHAAAAETDDWSRQAVPELHQTIAASEAAPASVEGDATALADPLAGIIMQAASGPDRVVGSGDQDGLIDLLDWSDALPDVLASSSRTEAREPAQEATDAASGSAGETAPTAEHASGTSSTVAETGNELQSFLTALIGAFDDLGIVLATDEATGRKLEGITGNVAPVNDPDEHETPVAGGDPGPTAGGTDDGLSGGDPSGGDPIGGGGTVDPQDGGDEGPGDVPPVDLDFSLFDAYEVVMAFARAADDGIGVYQSGTDFYMYELPALAADQSSVETEHLGTNTGLKIHLIGFAETFSEVWHALA